MLWEVEIRPAAGQVDREAARVLAECSGLGLQTVSSVEAARSGRNSRSDVLIG